VRENALAKLEFFFDCSSPWTYLAFDQIEDLATRTGATIEWRPILVGGVFNTVNQSVYEQRANPVPAKAKYHAKDLMDWARYYGVTIKWPSVFPVKSVDAMRGAIVADGEGKLPAYARRVFEAYWGEDQDISREDVLKAIAGEAGLDPDDFWTQVKTDRIKARLKENTEELIRRGGFGSPTMFVEGDDMYFGNDRLALVEAALNAARREARS
jgi:2-hydroxychromene-2-carboxylate isomerase